jgi:hypothetical protein
MALYNVYVIATLNHDFVKDELVRSSSKINLPSSTRIKDLLNLERTVILSYRGGFDCRETLINWLHNGVYLQVLAESLAYAITVLVECRGTDFKGVSTLYTSSPDPYPAIRNLTQQVMPYSDVCVYTVPDGLDVVLVSDSSCSYLRLSALLFILKYFNNFINKKLDIGSMRDIIGSLISLAPSSDQFLYIAIFLFTENTANRTGTREWLFHSNGPVTYIRSISTEELWYFFLNELPTELIRVYKASTLCTITGFKKSCDKIIKYRTPKPKETE